MTPPIGKLALVVVDAQRGFDDPSWGRRNNPDCDTNIARLVTAWADTGRPLVYVQHRATSPISATAPRQTRPFAQALSASSADLLVTKHVNSAFHGEPDLHRWLAAAGITEVAVCGITTNHCCETTARVAGNLGYRVWFALDATHTFDRTGPDGTQLSADDLAAATATNLHDEFATVTDTGSLLALTQHD